MDKADSWSLVRTGYIKEDVKKRKEFQENRATNEKMKQRVTEKVEQWQKSTPVWREEQIYSTILYLVKTEISYWKLLASFIISHFNIMYF